MRIISQLFLFALSYYVGQVHAQSTERKEITLRRVFTDLVNAYGNSKAPPGLELLSNGQKERVLARYYPSPSPVIKIDEKLIDICFEMRADSLNALAFLLGHELAHYYAEHPWCSDYAFALGNSPLKDALKSVSVEGKIEKESFADSKGLFYAAVAGYKPFEIFSHLIDRIYAAYGLKPILSGYPSKEDRKRICATELRQIKKIYPLFEQGLAALKFHQYEKALEYFGRLIQGFPSREMYNNAGVAALLAALQRKPLQAKEFIYPVEVDTITRLYKEGSRGSNDGEMDRYSEMLNRAKTYFENALRLDPVYFPAKINLASVHDILGNFDAAIGVLNEIEAGREKEIATIVMLKAVAYYHNDNYAKLRETLVLWRDKYSNYYTYNFSLLQDEL